jgi:hypothetical protein
MELRCKAQQARRNWLQLKTKAQHEEWEKLCQSILVQPQQPAAMWRAFGKTLPSDFMPLRSVGEDASNPNASLPSHPQAALNTMATHFSHVCSEHQNLVSDPVHNKVKETLEAFPRLRQLSFRNALVITPSEVEATCRFLTNPSKAVGPDDIHPCFLRYATPQLYELLAQLMTFSVQHAVLPQQWKQANVTPLYKGKGQDISNPNSYRPISVTSAIVRVLERCLHERIQQLLDTRDFIIPEQSGFRKGRSCYDNIYQLSEAIQHTYTRGPTSHLPVAFLDLQKAFDSVWHDGLIYKLFVQARLPLPLIYWIQSFLTGRQLRVVQSQHQSDWCPITAGVPQGSVLAPLLFLIFINDIVKSKHLRTTMCLLADDVVLWPDIQGRYSTRYRSLQLSLQSCGEWAV